MVGYVAREPGASVGCEWRLGPGDRQAEASVELREQTMDDERELKRTPELSLSELGINVHARVIRYPDGTGKLLIKKPSGEQWIDLRNHDFLESGEEDGGSRKAQREA